MELLTSASWNKLEVVVAALVVGALFAAPLLYNLWVGFVSMCWRPLRIKRAFEAQHIPVLPYYFLYGNNAELLAFKEEALRQPMPQLSHDIVPRILPECYHWAKKYGVPYVHFFGSQVRYTATNAEDGKEVLSSKFGYFPKADPRPDASNDLLGNGLVTLGGEKWARHRRMLNPAFFLEKLKAMIPAMEACTLASMAEWAVYIKKGQAIDVQKGFDDMTADIIAHTAFGSCFAEGKRVFELQFEQQIVMERLITSTYIPGARFIPTPFNRHAWKLDKDIKECIRRVITKREKSAEFGQRDSFGHDLLGLMMAANKHELQGNQKNLTMDMEEIIDECKTFFFAGHETTSTLLTWACLLLASSPEWQTRAREEVIAVCGTTDTPTAEAINQLKIVGMVLYETLRLYPPVILTARDASAEIRLGEVLIPKGTTVTLPILLWHHDKRYWGEDASEFRPDRFQEGVGKASRVPGAFAPFIMGPRVCIGQNYAMLEAKVVLSTILRRYRVHLSPAYKHAPINRLTLQPQFGMPILFEEL